MPAAGIVVALQTAGAQAPAPVDKKPKKAKKDKTEKAPKDPNAPKKKKKSDQPAPDDLDDPDAEPMIEPGVGFVWKAHPSFRFGENFRLDFEAKLQEDAHAAYPNAPGLECAGVALPTPCTFQLHRNRVGVKGTLFKKIDYE